MEMRNYDLESEPKIILIILSEGNKCGNSQMDNEKPINIKKKEIPIWEKKYLTIPEAIKYSNIGDNNLKIMLNKPECDFVVYLGNRKLINRQGFEEYLNTLHSL
ncbi:MAG: hypothetical protein LUH02_11020 [Erysipelotrichaceae bacterium]|nr:hypothetical protein [Erysipelotrichaceae bacterium]